MLSTVMVMFGKSLSRKTKSSRNIWNPQREIAIPTVGLKNKIVNDNKPKSRRRDLLNNLTIKNCDKVEKLKKIHLCAPRGRTEKVGDDLGGESRRRESKSTYECCARLSLSDLVAQAAE